MKKYSPKEIIVIDLSGSMLHKTAVKKTQTILRLLVEASNYSEIYVYAVGEKSLTLLTPQQYKWFINTDVMTILNEIHIKITKDSGLGTLFICDKKFSMVLDKVIPKHLLNGSMIRFVTDLFLDEVKPVREYFYSRKVWTFSEYNVIDRFASLLWKKLDSMGVQWTNIEEPQQEIVGREVEPQKHERPDFIHQTPCEKTTEPKPTIKIKPKSTILRD